MKKLILILFLGIFACNFSASAQNTTSSVSADQYKELLGKYTFKEAPFAEVVVSVSNGILYGEAVGQGTAELKPTNEADIFEIVGYDGKVKFIKTDMKNVDKVELTFQGQTFSGEKIKE